MVFPRARVAVFVDGCFWHGCPDHHTAAKTNADFWAAKVDGNRRRDAETDTLLAANGWTVIRIWEHVPVQQAVNLVTDAVAEAMERQQGAAQRETRRTLKTAAPTENHSHSSATEDP
jgi:DNA mismatch endonuclease (patch repair protein)